jgi:hypothetical protein
VGFAMPTPIDAPTWPEPRAIAEKRVLICLLAMHEAERRGVAITSADVQLTSDEFRLEFGLAEPEASFAWMKRAGLDEVSYTRFMHYMTAVRLVQAAMASEIEGLLDLYRKIESVRYR